MKFLIDEDLTPDIVLALWRSRAIDSFHPRDRNILRSKDWAIVERACNEERVIVTANCKDYRKLLGRLKTHPGAIFIVPGGLVGEEQIELVLRAVDCALQQPSMTNVVLRVMSLESMTFEKWPPIPILE